MNTSNGDFKLASKTHAANLRYVTFTTFGDGDVFIKYYHWLHSQVGRGRDPQDKLLDLWSSPINDFADEPPTSLVKLQNDVGGGRFVPIALARQVWERLVELGWKVTT